MDLLLINSIRVIPGGNYSAHLDGFPREVEPRNRRGSTPMDLGSPCTWSDRYKYFTQACYLEIPRNFRNGVGEIGGFTQACYLEIPRNFRNGVGEIGGSASWAIHG